MKSTENTLKVQKEDENVEQTFEASEIDCEVLKHIARVVVHLDPASNDPDDYLMSYQAEYQDYLDDGNLIDVS